MIKPELYEKTVGILVDAYWNDTLMHNNCSACAVGNIVAANLEIRSSSINEWEQKTGRRAALGWATVFCTCRGLQQILPERYTGAAKKQIDATGYTWQDLAKIEYAFEAASEGKSEDEWMFNGLMAVIEVLDQIHQNIDTELTTATKQRFKKACTVG